MTTDSGVAGIISESVQLPGNNGEQIDGYYARPQGSGPHPGIILIHEAFGLVQHTRELAHKFAAAGYATIAPNLYSRMDPFDPNDMKAVMAAMGELPDAQAVGDLNGAGAYVRSQQGSDVRLGAIGHCSGGRHTVLLACNTNQLSAAVDCYGGRVVTDETTPASPRPVIDMVGDLSCPLLGLFGTADQNPSPEHVATLEAALKQHGKSYDFTSYPAPAGHGFFADYRPSYVQEAATDGWQRIFDFFGAHLKWRTP